MIPAEDENRQRYGAAVSSGGMNLVKEVEREA